MPLSSFITGFVLSAGLIIAIGAQNAFVLRQGLRREHVGPLVFFCAASDALLMAAGVAGMGNALQRIPALADGLTVLGVLFLAWYGWQAMRRAWHPGALQATSGGGPIGLGSVMAQAAAFTLLNPHVYLDTVLLVGSVGGQLPPTAQPWFVAGAAVASGVWFSLLGYGARLLQGVFARPSAWRVLDSLIAVMMWALAVGLVLRLLA